jgi:hypothetical protein
MRGGVRGGESVTAMRGGVRGGESITAMRGGVKGGESITAMRGGVRGGESITAMRGGVRGGESITAMRGGVKGGESVNAKAELAIAQPATKAIRLTFIMFTPSELLIGADAGRRDTAPCIDKSDATPRIPSQGCDDVCLRENLTLRAKT